MVGDAGRYLIPIKENPFKNELCIAGVMMIVMVMIILWIL